MKDFFSFLFSKGFLKHAVIALACMILVLWGLFKLMGSYTHHDERATVPDFTGQSITNLNKFIEGKNVRYLIVDSLYDPTEKPGMVIKQDPEAKSEVKHNRMIYLYVTSQVAPQIQMPKLVDKSTRQALFMIESYGLKAGRIDEINADCNGCVLKQLYKGKEIAVGKGIQKGSKIDLVVGKKDNYYSTDTTSAQSPTSDDID